MRLPSAPFPEAAGPSMAMIMRSRSLELRAKLCHQLCKVGEAGRNHARIVDRDRLARGKAEREKGHGNAVIHMRCDETAAFDLSPPHDGEIVALDARLDPAGGKPGSSSRKAITLLHLELRQSFHAGLALG